MGPVNGSAMPNASPSLDPMNEKHSGRLRSLTPAAAASCPHHPTGEKTCSKLSSMQLECNSCDVVICNTSLVLKPRVIFRDPST